MLPRHDYSRMNKEWKQARQPDSFQTHSLIWLHFFITKILSAYLEKLTFEETKSQMKISTVSSEEMISKNKSLQPPAMLCCTLN